MSDIQSPATPTPANNMEHLSSPLRAGVNLTPPPSTHLLNVSNKTAQEKFSSSRETSLLSPPASLRTGPPVRGGSLYGELPSVEMAQTMDINDLRNLVADLLPALGEARVSVAHLKLQHNLLAIESEESAKRAEVEHEATRREVQVLQENSPVNRNHFSPRSPQASMQRNLQLALAHCRELQEENAILDKRLRSLKKIVAQLDGENTDLKDENKLLRQRIRENRDHLNEMQSSGALSINGTPMTEYGTPMQNRTPRTPANTGRPVRDASHTVGSQDPIDNLLLAGHYLNAEASSVPTTPSQHRPRKPDVQHLRGAHSLSSLTNTPSRSRPVTAGNISTGYNQVTSEGSFSAPGTQIAYHEESRAREDRDSTISASDTEDELQQEDNIPGSQASQLATSMLRRSLDSKREPVSKPLKAPDSSRLMQATLFGKVKKPTNTGPARSQKRPGGNSFQESSRNNKKTRLTPTEQVGLGIKS